MKGLDAWITGNYGANQFSKEDDAAEKIQEKIDSFLDALGIKVKLDWDYYCEEDPDEPGRTCEQTAENVIECDLEREKSKINEAYVEAAAKIVVDTIDDGADDFYNWIETDKCDLPYRFIDRRRHYSELAWAWLTEEYAILERASVDDAHTVWYAVKRVK